MPKIVYLYKQILKYYKFFAISNVWKFLSLFHITTFLYWENSMILLEQGCINIWIDEVVPCLKDTETGEIKETDVV